LQNRVIALARPAADPTFQPRRGACSQAPECHTGVLGERGPSHENRRMRIVLQRVTRAQVEVAGETVGSIAAGLVIFLGVTHADTRADADYLASKVIQLRIFPDHARRMNRSLLDAGGALLVISQFTLYGDCRKGRRPSFDRAASPEHARGMYEYFVQRLKSSNVQVETGVFQAEMEISLVNDGPVTFVLDSKAESAAGKGNAN
jgi:D-aminoacyl-tRNA deacylase